MRGEEPAAVLQAAVPGWSPRRRRGKRVVPSGTALRGSAGAGGAWSADAARLDCVDRVDDKGGGDRHRRDSSSVERGSLTLDQPVGEIVPYLDEVQVLDGFDAEGVAILRAPTRRVATAPAPAHAHLRIRLRLGGPSRSPDTCRHCPHRLVARGLASSIRS